jgi:hypothetical protein
MESNEFLGFHKLSKRFLMGLPAGLYLASNCLNEVSPHSHISKFYEYVTPHKERDAQWERIKAAHADGRNCCVYKNVEEYKKFLEDMAKKSAKGTTFRILEIDKP